MRPNGERVLRELARSGELSRAGVAQSLGLPKTTVAGVIDELLERGLVSEGPRRSPQGPGRPAKVLTLAGPRRVIGAVVASTHTMRAALLDPAGELLAERRAPMDAGGVPAAAIALLDAALQDASLARENLGAAVLGVPAPFQRGIGLPALRGPERVPGYMAWLGSDPAAALTDRLGIAAVSENDANLGALGEAAFGAGRELSSFVHLKLGPSAVGAGLVFGGRLHRGAAGFAGELAHVQVREDGPLCPCGGRGCLGLVLGPAWLDLAGEAALTFPEVLALAESGAPGPRRILRDLGRALGRPLADLCTLLNPAAIVVDGTLGPAGPHVIAGLRDAIDRHASPVAAESVRVLPGELGDRAELLGAVALAREESLVFQSV